tara:strand:+ start:101 stop:718 length:618 start_codon:yes stop_codon:yes gene_type:complete
MSKQTINIILADDHILIQEGIRARFEDIPHLNIVDTSFNGEELLEKIPKHPVDVAIVDINMPKMDGIEASKKIKHFFPKIKILMLTMHDDKEYLNHALKSGANGYILKDASIKEMVNAVETVHRGEQYLCHRIQKIVKTKSFSDLLTNKERDIVNYLLDGLSNKEIANKTFVSIRTVECHRNNIYKKLNINSVAALFKYSSRNKI